MTDCYHVTVSVGENRNWRGRPKFWIIEVHELDEITQARWGREEIDLMTQDLIALMTDQEGPFRVLYEFI